MPIGTISYLDLSSALITDAADTSDTSCSTDRPPKITPTRMRRGKEDEFDAGMSEFIVILSISKEVSFVGYSTFVNHMIPKRLMMCNQDCSLEDS
jgi:hypothetical protein